jgi:hypothetical protein
MFDRWLNIAKKLLRREHSSRPRRDPLTICRLGMEHLEDRLALDAASGDPFWYVNPVLAADSRVGAELSLAATGFRNHGENMPLEMQQTGELVADFSKWQFKNDAIAISARAANDAQVLATDLAFLGMESPSIHGLYVDGFLPVASIPSLAELDSLVWANPIWGAATLSGLVTTGGDAAQRSPVIRNTNGLTGSGVDVAVISDSYDNGGSGSAATDIASGDLPGTGNPQGRTTPVHIINDNSAGTDEGRAMLQIIHDIAPEARLLFSNVADPSSGMITFQTFADSILEARNQGADIIVDDLFFYTEPFFMETPITDAIDDVVADGAIYFSAAGNFANDSYEAFFDNSGISNNVEAGGVVRSERWHDFNPDPNFLDIAQRVIVPPGQTVFSFQWDDPYSSIAPGSGGATRDFDIYLYTPAGGQISAGVSSFLGGDPVELVSVVNPSTVAIGVDIFIGLRDGANPGGFFKYVMYSPNADAHVNPDQFPTYSPTWNPHANAVGAIGVGAAYYQNTPAFGVNPPALELFSSSGPGTILFDINGNRLATPQTRNVVDIVAPDGGNTTFFGAADPSGTGIFEHDGYPNFFGTSAAAPHAAAAAAQLKQVIPNLTSAELQAALYQTAIDMDDPFIQGLQTGFDNATGPGFIDAVGALYNAHTAYTPQLAATSDTGVFNNDRITSVNTPTFTVTAFSNAYVRLYVDDIERAAVQLENFAYTADITLTSALTHGAHNVTIRAAENASVPTANLSKPSPPLMITIDTQSPTAPGALDLTANDTGNSSTDNITSDTTPTFTWSAASGTGSGITGYWWAIDDTTPSSGGTFTTSLTATPTVTANSGHTIYVAAVEVAGNIGSAASLPFTIDTVASRITDVKIFGTGWTRDPYSFDAKISAGRQLAPIVTLGANQIQIQFTEDVVLTGSEMTLIGSRQGDGVVNPEPNVIPFNPANPNTNDEFIYDPINFVATWIFHAPLPRDKYRIELTTAVQDAAGNALDGEWSNLTAGTPDNFTDDPANPNFQTGNGAAGGDFEFFFSILPGDYNQDGELNGADYVVWQNVRQGQGTADIDGNGDGIIDDTTELDYHVWNDNYLTSLPLRNKGGEDTNRGDYNDDEKVDQADYDLLVATLGNTPNNPNPAMRDMRADGNGDGIVNESGDRPFYEDNNGDYSAWGTAPSGAAAQLAVMGPILAPTVVNVTVSGSQSLHDPFSFDTVDGTGNQIKSVPVGSPDTISITFSKYVMIESPDCLRLVGLYSAHVPEIAEFTYDYETNTGIWRFDDLVANDMYIISLDDEDVVDADYTALDGEWINPVSITSAAAAISEFPSGNGTAGGDFNFVITLLSGDFNFNNIVDEDDAQILSDSWSNPELEFALFADGDAGGDGVVDSLDTYIYALSDGFNRQVVWMLADLNSDDSVDEFDAAIIEENYLDPPTNPTWADGDLDGDGDIDFDDFDLFNALYDLVIELA